MEHLIRALLSIAAILLVGYAAVLLIFRSRPIRSTALSFVFALGIGFGLLAECGMISLALTGRVDFRVVCAVVAVAAAVVLFVKRGASLKRLFSVSRLREITRKGCASEGPAALRVAAGIGKSFVAIVTLIVAFNLLARPMYQFDSRAIWGLKAKILFHERTIFSPSVEDMSRNHPHPRYPLLVPVALAWVFESMGDADDRAVRILFLAFFLGLIAAAYRLPQRHPPVHPPARLDKIAGIVSVAVLAVSPYVYGSMTRGASSGYADITLTFYIAASVLAMSMWIRERKAAFAVAGALLAAFAALTKNEGLIFALNLFVVTAAFSLAGRKKGEPPRTRALYSLAACAMVAGAALLPWLCVRAGLPTFLDEDYTGRLNWGNVSAGLVRVPTIARFFGAELLNVRHWGLIWALAAASTVAAWRKKDTESRFISVVMALQVTAYLAVFMVTPSDYVGQMKVSVPRLLLHVLPLGAALIAIQAAGSLRTLDKRPEISD